MSKEKERGFKLDLANIHRLQALEDKESKSTTIPFSNNLKKLIKQKQIENATERIKPVKEIAKDLGISYQSLLNYQEGQIPTYKMLLRIQEYFNISYEELMGYTDDYKPKGRTTNITKSPLSKKALENLDAMSKNKPQHPRIQAINQLLENPKLLDCLISIINYKK